MTPRQLWVKALRSGKYKQGRHFLRMGDEYCCLGVACDLYLNGVGRKRMVYKKHDVFEEETYSFDGESHFLPPSVQQWLGLRTKVGAYTGGAYNRGSLLLLTDWMFPFSTIADLIESEPEGLFND